MCRHRCRSWMVRKEVMMAKPLTDKECKDILIQAKQWSKNCGATLWMDFVNMNTLSSDTNYVINFEMYGLTEYAMFGECLTLFNDRGFDSVTELIEEVLDDVA